MTSRTGAFFFSACGALLAALTTNSDAQACGGCFTTVGGGSESSLVTGHRMALSVSKDRTVLWDQIRYQGQPEEFAWVLPVRPGTTVELASDAFFEALDAATATTVTANPVQCSTPTQTPSETDYPSDGYYYTGCSMTGCSAGENAGTRGEVGGGETISGTTWTVGGEPSKPVDVVHEESIGPYEAVVLSSNEPGALYDWLLSHGYSIDPTMEPVIDDYEAQGFDFVGLRLIPGANTRQMRPVRITSPGASPVLPLRMVAAGTGANVALTLFVIGEGRWEAANFNNEEIRADEVIWDLNTASSNYSALRAEALSENAGATWLTTYSKLRPMLSTLNNPNTFAGATYRTSSGTTASNIAALYASQGAANGENVDLGCLPNFDAYAFSPAKVVDLCAPPAEGSGGAGGGENTGGGGIGGGSNTSSGTGGGGSDSGGGPSTGGSVGMGGSGGAGGTGAFGGATAGTGGGGVGGSGASGGTSNAGAGGGAAAGGDTNTGGANGTGAGGSDEQPECVGPAKPDEIDSRAFVCGDLDDIAMAFIGNRPADVWLTRLEANLPHEALNQDLGLQAAFDQSQVENWRTTSAYAVDPCAPPAIVAPPPSNIHKPRPWNRGDLFALMATLFTLILSAARRQLRVRQSGKSTPALS